jgi:hypothetical protein
MVNERMGFRHLQVVEDAMAITNQHTDVSGRNLAPSQVVGAPFCAVRTIGGAGFLASCSAADDGHRRKSEVPVRSTMVSDNTRAIRDLLDLMTIPPPN